MWTPTPRVLSLVCQHHIDIFDWIASFLLVPTLQVTSVYQIITPSICPPCRLSSRWQLRTMKVFLLFSYELSSSTTKLRVSITTPSCSLSYLVSNFHACLIQSLTDMFFFFFLSHWQICLKEIFLRNQLSVSKNNYLSW